MYANFFFFSFWLHWVLVAACGIYFPDQESNPSPLHWKLTVLACGPPGKSLYIFLFFLTWCYFALNRLQYHINITFTCTGKPKKKKKIVWLTFFTVCSIEVGWNWTRNISEVCLCSWVSIKQTRLKTLLPECNRLKVWEAVFTLVRGWSLGRFIKNAGAGV